VFTLAGIASDGDCLQRVREVDAGALRDEIFSGVVAQSVGLGLHQDNPIVRSPQSGAAVSIESTGCATKPEENR